MVWIGNGKLWKRIKWNRIFWNGLKWNRFE
jgi:hypothetical protein